jgi:uncharacterized protein with beta-barrel porin domain
MAGIDRLSADNNRFGLFFGGSFTDIDVDFNSNDLDITTYYGGLYAGRHFNAFDFDASLTLGQANYESNRRFANNTVPGGIENAKADYSGFFINPQITAARPIPITSGVSLVPSLRLGYTGIFIKSYQEAGSSANLSVGKRDLHLFQSRAQVGIRINDQFTEPKENQNKQKSKWDLELFGGVDGRVNIANDSVDATLIGQTISFDPGGDDKVLKGFGGLNMDYTLTNAITLSGSTEAGVGTDNSFYTTGRVRATIRF